MLTNQKRFLSLILLFLSIVSLSFSQTCTEQWSELKLGDWIKIGDANIVDKNGLTFEFEKESSSSDVVGAVWNTYDFSKKKGLLISFKPTIKSDPSYLGNVKYPYGFAIVFTSSSIDNLVGEKGSGIGYQGIMNSVVFEFDFVKHTANSDKSKPHFSVHYNISGPVSASSEGYDEDIVNRLIPNFYDNSLEGYYKNIIFEIQLIGNRIIVKSNRNNNKIVDYTFTEFQQLLEQKDVHVGITASMNQYKKVTITDFKISEISTKDKANLAVRDSSTIKAGEEVTLLYSINSICGEKLKIYSDEYTSDDFKIKINNKEIKPNSISFNEDNVELEIVVSENYEDTYTAIVEYKDHISSPTQFKVTPNDVLRYELCNSNKENPYYITSELQQTKDFFYVPICAYDQYDNSKVILYSNFDVRVKYPYNLLPDNNQVDTEVDSSNKRMIVKIPVTTFGMYEIFIEKFIDQKKRYLNFLPKYISPEQSELSILYDYNIVGEMENITLKIDVRDNYGRDIPNGILREELKCNFGDSTIKEDSTIEVNQYYGYDSVLLTVNKNQIKKQGKYTFVPKVRCENIPLTEFHCHFNLVKKFNNCEFFYDSTNINKKKIKAFSDFVENYFIYDSDNSNKNPLILSLDENENKKLTEIIFFTDEGTTIQESPEVNVEANLKKKEDEGEGDQLTVVELGNKYALILPNGKTRDNYSPIESYNIVLTVDESINITIPIKFYFIDHFMCNVDTKDNNNDSKSYIAFYKQNSLELKASETLLLFDVYELTSSKYLGNGESLQAEKIELSINSDTSKNEIVKYSSFISVSSHALKKAGLYYLQLKYDGVLIQELNLTITAKDDPYYLGDEKGNKLSEKTIEIGAEQLLKFTILDKYENIIKDDQIFSAFAKIKIINPDLFNIKPKYDGKIHIFNKGKIKDKNNVMNLVLGDEYTIESSYSPTFENVDPLNSYGTFAENFSPIITTDTNIKLFIFFKDTFGNTITGKVNKDKIKAFIQGKNLREIIVLNTAAESSTAKGIEYSGIITKNGDFTIRIFINDFPVECRGCNFRNSKVNIIDDSNAILYLIGNKRKTPIMNSYNKTNNIKAVLIDKNVNYNNLVFYFEQRDKYLNEVKDTRAMIFTIESENKIDLNDITINSYGSSEDEKGFLKIENIDKLKKLPDGLYKIKKQTGTVEFYIYLTSSIYDSEGKEPSERKSMILLDDNKIYGKIDVPISFILDLRSENYKRIPNINKGNIKIMQGDNIIKSKIIDGPEEGLLTVFLLPDKPGKYDFKVYYNDKQVISDTYSYICGCGLEKKLLYKDTKSLKDGNYIFFTLADIKGNECYNTINLNEFKVVEYINDLVKVKSSSNANKIFKTEAFIDVTTNTFILYLDRHVSGEVTLSSDFIDLDHSEISLTSNIPDSNHFIVKKELNSLKIKPLDDNYEYVTKTQLLPTDFDATLIKIVNDDTTILKNNLKINDDLTVDISSGEDLIDGKGTFLYIVYFRGKEIFCENCLTRKDEKDIDINKIKIYHKEGNNYFQSNDQIILPLQKRNFPFFKINLMSNNDNLVIVDSDVDIVLKGINNNIEIQTNIKYASNGNIYVYLNKNGRESYLKLPPMEKLNLKVTYKESFVYDVNYYIIDHFVEEPSSIENCAYGAIPNFINGQSLFIKRFDEDLELDIHLSGCAEQEKNIFDKLKILERGKTIDEAIDAQVIPTDIYGGYLLFLPNSLPVTDSNYYFIVNENSKSIPFELSIMPGYDIKKAEFREDEKMTETTTDKLYAYFLIELKDKYNNLITNIGRNMFTNDFYGITINDLPFLLSYDEKEKTFRCQVPINGNGRIEVSTIFESKSSPFYININESQIFMNSVFTLTKENGNEFIFKVNLKDEFYKEVTSEDYMKLVTFKYYTYNPVSDEVFVIPGLKIDSREDNTFKIVLTQGFPKYSIYGFIPLIKVVPQICLSCFKKKLFQNFVFTIGEKGYFTHNIEKEKYLIDKYDYPTYLYLSHKDVTINSEEMETEKLISNSNTKLYLLTYKGNSKTINVNFRDEEESKNLKVNLLEYSDTVKISDYTGTEYVERYGYNTYNINMLDIKGVTFFMEIRNNKGKLITTTPSLLIDNEHRDIIKKLTIIKTSYQGNYLVKMTFSKSGNLKYYLKFTENQSGNEENSIKLNIVPAFPNQIVLTDKERINSRIIKYEFFATNANAEQICDERLNLYINDINKKSISTELIYVNETCSLYVKFYGDAIIKSNIDNFTSEINNNDNTLYNLNPQFSSMTVSPNVFTADDTIIAVTFNENSPSLTRYNKDEVIGNKNLYAYQYISPIKIRLIKSISNLFSSQYTYTPDKFNFKQDQIYILIGTILDSILFPSFAYYQIEKTSKLGSLKVEYFSEEKKSYSLLEFDTNPTVPESFVLNLPLFLVVNFLDSNGAILDIDKNNKENLSSSLILYGNNTLKNEINLIIRQYNDNYFFITIDSSLVSTIKHLPTSYQELDYKYLININLLDKEFYSSFSLNPNIYQVPSYLRNIYSFSLNDNSLDSFSLKTEQNLRSIQLLKNTANIHHICLFIDEKDEDKYRNVIFNKHLDYYKIQMESECTVHYVNSYIGCIDFTMKCSTSKSLTFKYDNKVPSSSFDISLLDNPTQFNFYAQQSTNVFNSDTDGFAEFLFNCKDNDNKNIMLTSNKYYNLYINGERVNKKDLSIFESDNNIKMTLGSSYFEPIPRNKSAMIIYFDGINKREIITEKILYIIIKQKSYIDRAYSFQMQDPLDIFAGDNLYFYLNIKDHSYACYYEEIENLSGFKAITTINNKEYEANITSTPQELKDNSKCKYIYIIDFGTNVTKSGDLNVKVEDSFTTKDFKIYILPKEIDSSKSAFSGDSRITAGQVAHLSFTSKDEFDNTINYFDLFKKFDIILIDSNETEVDKDSGNYTYTKKVESDNSKINIDIKINNYGTFYVKALVDNNELEISHKISVSYGICSLKDADPQNLPIDNRYEYYPGETITIQIDCKDSYGNNVTEEGNSIFTANIKQNELTYIYKKSFENGHHLIKFTPPTVGSYYIEISLNGKKYGKTLEIKVQPIDHNKYNCMDKRLVDNIEDCNTDKYKELLLNILGEKYVCDNNNETEIGKLFKCTEESDCVLHTNECGCLNELEEWNGYCYKTGYNPVKSIITNKITCLSKLKAKHPNTTAVVCEDGSCRINPKECNTTFECPIGFKVCGVKCILLNELCTETVTCSSDEVLCWDLSCAKGYDLCPTRTTCPEDKVLCPDGSCQKSGFCVQPVKRTCEKNQYQCPDFSCVSSKSDCKKNAVCEPGYSLCEDGNCKESCQEVEINPNKYRCSNGDYKDNIELCPSDMFIPQNYIKCPNGGIASNFESCSFVQESISINCPKSKPILCPDFACVEKSSDCSSYIPTCPPHKPFKCWNNECRTSFDECPTPVTCPEESPILCQSGLCVKSVDECKVRDKDTCPYYRCFDGTCVKSMELCPTYTYCGKDIKKCWNGACVLDINECRSTILEECPTNFPYRCPDGSCRKASYECSTISVCPAHLPIKCFDNSCRASIEECPNYHSCGANKVSCPDGTCAPSFEYCNTIVTCYTDSKPFLCYDNSCQTQLNECPRPPKCSKNEVLCPNGACLSSRQNCKIFDPCEASTPIRCESNTCTDNYNECNKKSKRCPIGYIQCANGDCKTSDYLCDEFNCPKNKPHFCKEGVCVNDPSLCDNILNGCPYNKNFKCKNGTCVEDEKLCKDFSCKNGLYLCPDGSCIENKDECPKENGCYEDRPFKCADGTCINPETTTCSIVLCPYDAPFKCPNGYCASKSSDCPLELRESDLNGCQKGFIMCVDGRCVPSSDYCRPAFQCESGYTLCYDGTCRVSPDICPQNIECPNGRHHCAFSNKCVSDPKDCSSIVCPNDFARCENNGLCLESQEYCGSNPDTDNYGCSNGGVKCPNGRCMKSLSECSLISNACPDDDEPYLCSNGECVDDISKCNEINNPGDCEEGKERCPTGRCVEKNKFKTLCSNIIGCPLNKPYRCSNGECMESDRKCDVTTLKDSTLKSNIACDASKPYLCADKSCVSDPSFCKPFQCPDPLHTCNNGYCVEKPKDPNLPDNINCQLFAGFCPISNPIHCPSGSCVDNIAKCSTSFPIPKCSEGQFYCARLNQCLHKKLDCLIYYDIERVKKEGTRNLLENFVDPLENEDFINMHKKTNKDIISLIEEDNDSDKDNKEVIDGTFCYDGTLATGNEKCPPVPACKMGEYRCENGGCASDKDKCYKDEEYKCIEGKKKCPDGMCHSDCNEVSYQGCEVGKYQCTNGLCVEDKYDCIGYSMCQDVITPFRCINGECKSSPEECESIERLGTVKNLTYSFNRQNKIEFDFAFNNNGRSIGRIEIPSQALLFSNDKIYSRLYIKGVPSSKLYDSSLYNKTAEFLFNVSNSISYSEGNLNFENSVMSPVFKFYYEKSIDIIEFNISGRINIAHNEYDASGFNYSDYCLAKLNGYDLDEDIIKGEEPKWICVERQTAEKQTEFQIKEFGVYAVILNPLRQKINYFGNSTAKNFFLENVKIILIVLACIIVIVALVFYIFLRVTRYRQKYHENRAKILLLQQQKQEYENMTTDIFGQTLGDNINGIVYKANPAYTVTEEIKKSGTSLEDEIEKLQIECRNVNDQNERLQKDIADITEQYKVLSASIENMNK